MGSLKSPKRSKWNACFKPNIKDCQFEPVSSSRKGENETKNVLMTLSGYEKVESSSDREDQTTKKSNSRHKNFSRAFKAALFQSSPAKKKRSRKSGQEQEKSSRSSSFKLSSIFNSYRNKKTSSSSSYKQSSLDRSLRTDSSRSSLLSSSTTPPAGPSSPISSSRASSFASSSRSASERKRSCSFDFKQLNQKPTIYSEKTKGYYNVGLYMLLLICLVGLVFLGRAFAIFCTSTCLFLIPSRLKRVNVDDQSAVNNTTNVVDFTDIDSYEYKKKVIMEGLLERNRNTRSYSS